MRKDFTRKRTRDQKKYYELLPIVDSVIRNVNKDFLYDGSNILCFMERCYGGCKKTQQEKEEFVKLTLSMIENDKECENWKIHLDKGKTIEQTMSELKVFIAKFDEINDKMDTIAHCTDYESYCTMPTLELGKIIR